MPEFKDRIPAAGGKVEYLYDADRGIAAQVSGTGFRAIYQVALSIDGRHLLATVPAGGIGSTAVYPQPSILAFVQSDEQGMWGRNCPSCEKYFRTTHIMGPTTCPYCSENAPDLAFVSREQKAYLTACYDAFARAYLQKKSTSVDLANVTDEKVAWHYAEEKQQLHFTCQETAVRWRQTFSASTAIVRAAVEAMLAVSFFKQPIKNWLDWTKSPPRWWTEGREEVFGRR